MLDEQRIEVFQYLVVAILYHFFQAAYEIVEIDILLRGFSLEPFF